MREREYPCAIDMWDAFKGWLTNEDDWGRLEHDMLDILTTPALLAQAIISWWETRHEWKGDRYE
jgi:hypothetical protein